jgi:hypothetical protein
VVDKEKLIKQNAYEILSSYNIKDGCFTFVNRHTTANSLELREKSKDKLIALEYSIINGYCIPMVGETGIENLYKVTDKGHDFILEYHFDEEELDDQMQAQ